MLVQFSQQFVAIVQQCGYFASGAEDKLIVQALGFGVKLMKLHEILLINQAPEFIYHSLNRLGVQA